MAGEKNFENKIKAYLTEHEIWHVKYFANRNTKSGIPDILACVNGFFLAVEVKAANGKPSELQMLNIRRIHANQGFAVVLYPSHYDDFVRLVQSLSVLDVEGAVSLESKINERR